MRRLADRGRCDQILEGVANRPEQCHLTSTAAPWCPSLHESEQIADWRAPRRRRPSTPSWTRLPAERRRPPDTTVPVRGTRRSAVPQPDRTPRIRPAITPEHNRAISCNQSGRKPGHVDRRSPETRTFE